MTFWNNAIPHQKHKFKIKIGDEIFWHAKSADMPKLTMEYKEVKFGLGDYRKYAKSQYVWKPITIEVLDMQNQSGLSTAQEVFFLMLCTANNASLNAYTSIAKNKRNEKDLIKLLTSLNTNLPISKFFMVKDNILNPRFFNNQQRISQVGVTNDGHIEKIEIHKLFMNKNNLDIEEVNNEFWILEDCLLVDVDFGSSDYTSEDLNYISLTLQPVACRLENSVGRTDAYSDLTTSKQ